MNDIAIRPLLVNDLSYLPTVIIGYVTTEKYTISKIENELEMAVSLKLVTLPAPKTISYDHLNEAELARLAVIVAEGWSFAVFSREQLVGVIIGGLEAWNKSVRVWEFHVAELYRRQGIGRLLMEKIVETAVTNQLRIIVCETQSSNVPAIRAYRRLGFELDAIDLSFYSNDDVLQESVAVFMKRKL
ncbi:MAG: GNAT family N-acetyltransferase [Chloroflexi bacterium]|nr:GNAT family N-acetyltransferase [Chloroflexota bacterium]